MKHEVKATMRKVYTLFLVGLIVVIATPFGGVLATGRGISVVSKPGQSLSLYKEYRALVIGISNYEKWPKLPNAVNDAKEVATKLREMGFEVKLVLDPTSREMKTVLNEMVYDLGSKEDRALLFYYAGHGETETLADNTKLGYIIPGDCPLLKNDPMGFAAHAISMKDIESASLRIRAKHVLMLFDSCFSGSLFALVRAVPDDISEKSTLPVRQYITAGREDEPVPDKSMFKRCFLLALEGDADLTGDGYITGTELGMYLSDKVVNYTHRQQHPQYGKINNPDLDRGDFVFVPKGRETKAFIPSLDEERRRLSEEREHLKKEMEKLQAQKQLLEEKKLLESERQRPEKEKEKLASVSEPAKRAIRELRYGRGPFLIDDFEDKDLWSTYFEAKWGDYAQGQASLKVSADPTQGANGTSCSMKIEYKLAERSVVHVIAGGHKSTRIQEVQRDSSNAYDLSRFNKIAFYLKGRKRKTFLSKPNKLVVQISCYGSDIKSRYGKAANYQNKTVILPDTEWQKIEIPFDDFVVSAWTKRNASNYPLKPDLHNVLYIDFIFSGFELDGSAADSNTVWVDQIMLE
jgi:hypothetical protein